MDLKAYLKNHPKTDLIFDLDETLVWLILPWEKWEGEIEEKLKKLDSQILSDYQKGKIHLNQMQNAYVQKSSKALDSIIKNNEKFEKDNLNGIKVNQKIVDFIKEATGYRLYIWSANSKKTVEHALAKVGILKKFEKLVTRDDVGLLKPETEGFDLIWDKKTSKSKYLFIGDSANDKKVSERVGIDFYQEKYFSPHILH